MDTLFKQKDNDLDFRHLSDLDFTYLDPFDLDFTKPGAMAALAVARREMEVLGITVEAKPYAVPEHATGKLAGEVLAVGKHYTAQHMHDEHVVMHENGRLDRTPVPGDNVVIGYIDGQGRVLSQDRDLGDRRYQYEVSSPQLDPQEKKYLEQSLRDASYNGRRHLTPDELDETLNNALETAKETFGWQQVPNTIVTEYMGAPGMARGAEVDFPGVDPALVKNARPGHELNGPLSGEVVGESSNTVLQHLGRTNAAQHEKNRLDRVPDVGENVKIAYGRDGKAQVQSLDVGRGLDLGK